MLAQFLHAALAQAGDVAHAVPPAPAMPWWWQAASGVSILTAFGAVAWLATYKRDMDLVKQIVRLGKDENLGNAVTKIESVLYGDERTDPGIVKRVHDVESGLSTDRRDFAIFTERLEGILTRLEEKIDRLACGGGDGGGGDLGERKPLPRQDTNPRLDVSKLRKP